jgi:hypothetical protein
MPQLPEHCQQHGEDIATILQKCTSMESHLVTLNGRTRKNEDSIGTITVKQAAHDVIQVQMMQKLMTLEDSMGKMKDWRASVLGGAESTGKLIRDWAMILGLAVAIWQGWLSHQALMASQQQNHQQQQTQPAPR